MEHEDCFGFVVVDVVVAIIVMVAVVFKASTVYLSRYCDARDKDFEKDQASRDPVDHPPACNSDLTGHGLAAAVSLMGGAILPQGPDKAFSSVDGVMSQDVVSCDYIGLLADLDFSCGSKTFI